MKYFDMFAGCGGFSIGIERAYALDNPEIGTATSGEADTADSVSDSKSRNEEGRLRATCIGFSETDKYASAVLKYRYPNVKNYGDATKLDAGALPDFNLLTAGFPCQAFSIAGKRKGFEDTRGTLFFDVARVLKAKKPKYLIAENVKGLVSHDKGKTLKTILDTLQELGYISSIEICNAKDYSVPQNRERIFICGWYLPKVCQELISDGTPKRTATYTKIIKGFLCQSLLNNLAEVRKLQETESKDLVLGLLTLNAIIDAGRRKKWRFSTKTCKHLYESLKDCSLTEMSQLFTSRQENSGEKSDTKAGIMTEKDKNKFQSAEDEVWENIDLLLRDGSAELYQEPNKSITSTLINATTTQTTFFYAKTLRLIVAFTLHLRNSSSHLWNEVLSDLIILKVGTKYEPITNQTEEAVVGRSGFVRRCNLPDSFDGKFVLECGSGGERPREVFFEAGTAGKDNGKPTSNTIDANYGKGIDNHGARTGIMQLNNPTHSNDRVYGEEGISPTLNTMQGGRRQPFVSKDCRIRRLTTTECERLMSWPDGWTAQGADGPISDTQRYKMCGNGVVSEVVKHIVKNLII